MSASKDTKRGTWKVYIRYKDWQGVGQVHTNVIKLRKIFKMY